MFDDQPASYLSWKSSFNNAVEGLNLKPSEELDLIIKWIGGESLQHVKRIRAVHVNNPAAGLDMVWQRLDRSYGSPEAIEAFLFSRLHDFPKLSIKDSKKLQELSDLLFEILAAKKEGYLPGLNFLDTARGINPILEKLPHSIQEQWMSKGSYYKREHCFISSFFVFCRLSLNRQRCGTIPVFSSTLPAQALSELRNIISPKYGNRRPPSQ